MKYYISINSWNLLESFVTESLSPFAFYNKRNFGNNLSRFINNSNDKIKFIVLSTVDNGGDYSIIVNDTILDTSSIKPVKGLKTMFVYSKTLYYKKGTVSFRFGSQALLDAFVAESQILFEVKCIDKYKDDFFIKEVKEKKASSTLRRLGESFSFEQQTLVKNDNQFNIIKGAIVGYARGALTTSDSSDLRLVSMIKDIKNSFAGLNTQIMVNDSEVERPEAYIIKLKECKKSFNEVLHEKTNYFDILTQLFLEVRNLASLRCAELSRYKVDNKERLIDQKQDVEYEICEIERTSNISILKAELKQIKDEEKRLGERSGKTRIYFKKDTPKYNRKQELKAILKEFEESNEDYKALLRKLDEINTSIQNANSGKSQYDATLSALFVRISDITNNLQKKFDQGKSLNAVDFSCIEYTQEYGLELREASEDNDELEYFNVLIKTIVSRETLETISEQFILSLIEKSAIAFKSCPSYESEKGKLIMECLRNYWRYKHNQCTGFVIPGDMPVLQSVMSFFLKPFGFDQIERYMMNKKFTKKKYAMMLWAACNGYAALPKTFTSVLYQDEENYMAMDNLLEDIMHQLE
ncbi:lantibiotic ABC transporter [Prevotella sp. TCVGH]|uniref:lantibiotic ABC transporter n=1 Tax=Prevotellaceae TaxID=171552 RepID=UPI001898836F|nr:MULTISPECIES: lantibiotic ABC transporter [Prevotellaceae]MCL6749131.1 lantibiotic ABC transporter [Prevotella sp. TCVGH]